MAKQSQEVKTNYNKGPPNIDFIMMAPQVVREKPNSILKNNDISSTPKQQGKESNTKNTTNSNAGILVRIMQFKTIWNSDHGKNRSRRLLEMSLKPMFFICCICALVLIYLLYRAVKIRKNLKNDKHDVTHPNDSHKVLLNEA